VFLAEDLYNYSLPMLAKLEQEIPGMRLRLMGLRCTALVSTKKPDTMTFFGLIRPREAEGDNTTGKKMLAMNEEWEQWPEELLEPNREEEEAATAGSGPVVITSGLQGPGSGPSPGSSSPFRRHGKEVLPNPKKELAAALAQEECWDCPICARPQIANERQFNDHIDMCLSRRAIRDTVQQEAAAAAAQSPRDRNRNRGTPPESKKAKEKKRTRPAAAAAVVVPDPKQKRLCFG
jgi:DNA polymerase kappa